MRIALINGSPKVSNSTSGMLLEELKRYLGDNIEVVDFSFHAAATSKDIIEELAKTDAWVLAYPLYVDGIPGHLLSCLIQLEEVHWQNLKLHIYGIVNCGFYEGVQAEFALKLLQNWTAKASFVWGGGIGVGGGGGFSMMPTLKPGQGPKAPIDKALKTLAHIIRKKEVRENNYISVAFPRFLYKICAQMGWRQRIKANGGKVKDLGKMPEYNTNLTE